MLCFYSYLPTHLLLFGGVDLYMFAEGTGVCVAFSAAWDLTCIWFLKQEIHNESENHNHMQFSHKEDTETHFYVHKDINHYSMTTFIIE